RADLDVLHGYRACMNMGTLSGAPKVRAMQLIAGAERTRRGDEILLANHARHRNKVYTVLAGFVEVGETLEQAVAREV
ncbi:NUDIX domain-containing protein, partial [Pantoea agglomerans]|uniref:NUDIX domain-containing protein n=1 Tax=Enterobacter agglomerans TaxID=549 RepID=UPI001F5C9162